MSGWVLFISPNALITAFCHEPLMGAIDPAFRAAWLAQINKNTNDMIPPEIVPHINVPWMLVGTCDDTLHVCDPPMDNSTWTPTCTGRVRESYALCSNVALIGLNSALPNYEGDGNRPEYPSYQEYYACPYCPPPKPPCQACAVPNCTSHYESPVEAGNDFFSCTLITNHAWTVGIAFAVCIFALAFAAVVFGASYAIRRSRKQHIPIETDVEMTNLNNVHNVTA